MARSTTVFCVVKEVGYPKTDIFRGICSGKFLARNMEGPHDKQVVKREKLHRIRANWLPRQKSSMTIVSPERCRTAEMDTDRDVWPRNSLPSDVETSHDMEVVERWKLQPALVEWPANRWCWVTRDRPATTGTPFYDTRIGRFSDW